MLIQFGFEMIFEVPAPVPMMLVLFTHPEHAQALLRPERLVVEPEMVVEEFDDWFGNRCARILAPAGKLRLYYDNIADDSGRPEETIRGAMQHPVEQLPPYCLRYLLASRYCEVDRLSDAAWDLFGKLPPGWERVQAVIDWVHQNVTFGYEYADSSKTAYDVFQQRKGVCRDFQHLAITMLRALNVPARYATGYLGDIGVPASPLPMDFSAWFEVYLSGRWFTLDARHNEPRIGRILQARGRDATDVALTTSFGKAPLQKFTVWTDELKGMRKNTA